MNILPANIPPPQTVGSAATGAATGQAGATARAEQGILYQVLIIALGAAILAFGGAYFLRRERMRPRPALAPAAGAGPDLSEEGMASLMALAALDEAFERGEISEEDYRVRREAQKRRISEMLRQKGEGE